MTITWIISWIRHGQQRGCLFVDTSCRPDFSGRNTVIYGHRMKNGTMFAALGNYQEQVYYDATRFFCW